MDGTRAASPLGRTPQSLKNTLPKKLYIPHISNRLYQPTPTIPVQQHNLMYDCMMMWGRSLRLPRDVRALYGVVL